MGATDSYNQSAPGWAAIVAYTHGGEILCPTCAERMVGNGAIHAALYGDGLADTVPVASVDRAGLRGDCRDGCGVSCQDCGATILAACDPCAAGMVARP